MRTTGSEPNPICVQKPIHPRRQNAFAGLPALDNANVFSSCRSMTRLPLPRFDIIARISRSSELSIAARSRIRARVLGQFAWGKDVYAGDDDSVRRVVS